MLDELLERGVISIDYYRTQSKLLDKKIVEHENLITSIKDNVGKWGSMSNLQKQLYVSQNVERIVIDVKSQKIEKIFFKKM